MQPSSPLVPLPKTPQGTHLQHEALQPQSINSKNMWDFSDVENCRPKLPPRQKDSQDCEKGIEHTVQGRMLIAEKTCCLLS